jgi:hypothetical protein
MAVSACIQAGWPKLRQESKFPAVLKGPRMRRQILTASLIAVFSVALLGAPASKASSDADQPLLQPIHWGGDVLNAPDFPDAPLMRPEEETEFEIIDDMASELGLDSKRPSVTVSDDTELVSRPLRSRASIRETLRAQGFSEIDDLRRRGQVYVAEVTGPQGDRMRLVVDGLTGDVQGLRVLERAGEGYDRRAEREILDR